MAVAPEARGALALDPAVSATAERLFQAHSGWIYGYCLRLLRSPEDAEDALQATYLNAVRGLREGVRPRVDSAWLLRIAQNVCLTRLRSSGRRAKLEHLQDITVLEETVAAPVRSADELIGLTEALATLPEHQRRAILLREWQGLSYRELADSLGLTQAAVETLVFRARRSLAQALEQPGKRRRRLRGAHVFDLGGLAAALKGLLGGGAGVKAVAAAVAVATATTVAVADPVGFRDERQERGTPAAALTPAAGKARAWLPRAGDPSSLPASGLPVVAGEPAAGRAPGREVAEEAKARRKAKGKATAPGQTNEPVRGRGKGKAKGQANGRGAAKARAQETGQASPGNGQGPGAADGGQEAPVEPAPAEQTPPPPAQESPPLREERGKSDS